MPVSIRADKIIPQTGVRIEPFTIRNADLVDGVQVSTKALAGIADWFMVLSVTKDVGQFLRFDVRGTKCKTGADARRYVGSALRVQPKVLQSHDFTVVQMSKNADLHFDCVIDTDHAALLAKAKALQDATGKAGTAAGLPVPFFIDVFAVEPATRRVLISRVEATLSLAPMRSMTRFDGYVALDFGNTSTTLVRTRTNEDGFEVVQADVRRTKEVHGEPATPVQTALRIRSYKTAERPEHFSQYVSRTGSGAVKEDEPGEWLSLGAGAMGTNALTNESTDWLLLGAKRLLADRRRAEAGTGTVILLGNEVHTIPAEDPAELFIANMIAGFFFHEQAIPAPMVVTCPTTFNESEVARLRRTVARALHRVRGEPASSFRQSMVDANVPLVVDEASAAAFYFAWKDFVSGPGRMPAFRYLYPNGMHMLLYDCGGGTTDLSLVRLEAVDEGHLRLSVLGRAGHRTFGGDHITQQVFRLLKMRLALAKGEIPDPPPPAKLAEFLKKNERDIDRCVPTKYEARQMQNDEAKARRKATLALWQLAEAMKVGLASAPGVNAVEMDHLLPEVGKAFGLGDQTTWADRLEVSRKELDALIDPEIDLTIEYANDLIRTSMAARTAEQAAAGTCPLEIPEVNWVYVVGNASRYPRIKERMLDPQRGLQIRFLEDRIASVPDEDFKNAVAKGAVVAMRFQRQAMGTAVTWDEDLIRKLPFDIVHSTLGGVSDRVLFRSGDLYSGRMQQTIDVRSNPGSGRAVTEEIVLCRKWLGETKAEKYLVFRFKEPIRGTYVIEYDDQDEHAFIAYPDRERGRDERVVADPFETIPYIAPSQGGTI